MMSGRRLRKAVGERGNLYEGTSSYRSMNRAKNNPPVSLRLPPSFTQGGLSGGCKTELEYCRGGCPHPPGRIVQTSGLRDDVGIVPYEGLLEGPLRGRLDCPRYGRSQMWDGRPVPYVMNSTGPKILLAQNRVILRRTLGKYGTVITYKRIRLSSCFFDMECAIIIAIKTSKGRLKV